MKSIVDFCRDEKLFKPFLADADGSIATWQPWMVALKMLYGERMKRVDSELVSACTGRTRQRRGGFRTALFLTGRRSGKSRMAAVIGCYEAIKASRESKLAVGESGIVLVTSPTKSQSRIVRDYMSAVFKMPLFAAEVVAETRDGFELANGIRVEIGAGNWKTVRGYTLLAAVVDEVCFMGYSEESKVRSDTELIRAIQPSLATTGGRLICISSPYAMKGYAYQAWKKNFGNDAGTTLVWNCASRVMNSTLSQSIVDEAYQEDPASASAEYGGNFRDDIVSYLPETVIRACVVPGRIELAPDSRRIYSAFADVSGGRVDSAALCIAHREDAKVVIDMIRVWNPPHSPDSVIAEMCGHLNRYRVGTCTGDSYSAEFTRQAFLSRGIHYNKSQKNPWAKFPTATASKPRSQLYAELIPVLCSQGIELLDHDLSIQQLCCLERKTHSGGRDVIDHPVGGHDDAANAVAGVAVVCAQRRARAGAMPNQGNGRQNASRSALSKAFAAVDQSNFIEQQIAQMKDDGMDEWRSLMTRMGRR